MTIRCFSCRISNCDEPLAQQAEHLTFNQGVRRSNRRWLTISGALEKRLNSPAFHAGIQGFESPTRHQKKVSTPRSGYSFSKLLPIEIPCGCGSMVEHQLPKLKTRVRFPSPAPIIYEPLAQQAEHLTFNQGVRRSNRRWLTT